MSAKERTSEERTSEELTPEELAKLDKELTESHNNGHGILDGILLDFDEDAVAKENAKRKAAMDAKKANRTRAERAADDYAAEVAANKLAAAERNAERNAERAKRIEQRDAEKNTPRA